jgi:RNA-directed DNA polymerase
LEYSNCPLYELQSKKILKYLLGIKNANLLKQEYLASLVEPYIDVTRKPRLIEPPHAELKIIQKRIKTLLSKI